MSGRMTLRVRAVTWEAPGVVSLELRRPDGGELPPFTAGAHIDTHLRVEMTRSYSLTNAQEERDRYVIAVAREAAGRGGSAHVHDVVRPGDLLDVSGPRNNFALAEKDDAPTAMLAGGIGITPMVSMVRRLGVLGRPWQLTYCARTRDGAPFLHELDAMASRFGGQLRTNFDHEPGGRMLDVQRWVENVPNGAHLYCCGPAPMLAAFEAAARERPPSHVHLERFAAVEAPAEGGFTVHLARRKRDVPVLSGQTILDALLAANVPVDYSCSEGVCGTCEVGVLEGVPDHRDVVLSKNERDANRSIMICCSGSKTARLVLDL